MKIAADNGGVFIVLQKNVSRETFLKIHPTIPLLQGLRRFEGGGLSLSGVRFNRADGQQNQMNPS